MKRVFTVAPTVEQICTDILRLDRVLEQIVIAEGAIVPDLNFRSGHRALRHDKKGPLKTALKCSSRVSTYTMPAIHADAQAGIAALQARATAGLALATAEAATAAAGAPIPLADLVELQSDPESGSDSSSSEGESGSDDDNEGHDSEDED